MFRLFSIDSRSLAVFRIGLALLILWDLLDRSFALTSHYTNQGILPISENLGLPTMVSLWSFHGLSGSFYWQVALFVVAAIAAVFLGLGFKTKMVTIVSWVLVTSLQHRNIFVTFGGDDVLRLMLFWSMFLPLGLSFSLDARKLHSRKPVVLLSPFTAALLLQVLVIYVSAGLHKVIDPHWLSGEALSLAIGANPGVFGNSLRQFEGLTWGLTYVAVAGQLSAPLALLLPRFRLGLVILFIAIQLSMALILDLAFFPFACILTWLIFIPSWLWNRWHRSGIATEPSSEPSFRPMIAMILISALIVPAVAELAAKMKDRDLNGPWGLQDTLFMVGLNQRWRMFVPAPQDGFWLTVILLTDKNQRLDFADLSEFKEHKRRMLRHEWARPRWGALNFAVLQNPFLAMNMAESVCALERKQIISVQIFGVSQKTEPARAPPAPIRARQIVNYNCSTNPL